MTKEQESDNCLESLMRSFSGLEFNSIKLSSRAKLMCDVSTGTIRPYVPETFRKIVFDSIHSLSHPDGKTTVKLIKDRFIWPTLQKDCHQFSKNCIACQSYKISRHPKSSVGQFLLVSAGFKHILFDTIRPLPSADGFHYCLTCADRYSM
ncbi:hypothetical protein AVEN_215675-1 [Araneus ventricosus]|uniref:Integrase zinc-binding domain-containing protein n=1 Tax=Araneus ventricosus TaxID=182803 RepID=A0A4Y2MBE8_ARAVE|nr:hypothetical protein AVEN_215675-1 [Araneus ventricosus]